ncbi:MAG: hypothetical protein EXQ77_00615 [Thermoleophilia bacterium]|nr:hypothetical protein [Thermoleophilia bacterium]
MRRGEDGIVTHWDEIEPRRREQGHLGGAWQSLTGALSQTVGVQRIVVDPGKWATPLHLEGSEEEIFYVLAGSGVSVQRDGPDGSDRAFAVGSGDCLVHLASRHAHTLQAGADGLSVLAFGERHPLGNTLLPRAGVSWLGTTWVRAGTADEHPWTREAETGPPEVGALDERPGRIVNAEAVEPTVRRGATVSRASRDLGRAAGSIRTGLRLFDVDPGKFMSAPHSHSAEEELFVILAGDGMVELTPGPRARELGAEAESHPVRAGSTVVRRAATGVAHALRAGEEGLRVLAYGTRRPEDVAYYPRSNKLFFRGVGVIGRIEHLDYWDGED